MKEDGKKKENYANKREVHLIKRLLFHFSNGNVSFLKEMH